MSTAHENSLRTHTPSVQSTVLKGRLGPGAIMFMVLAAAAPLTVVGSVIPVGILMGNGQGFPAMFVVATVILLLFSIGLMAMSKHFPDAGAFFTYISHGLGTVPGVSAAYLAIITYSTIQFGVFAFFGETISADLVLLGAPSIPWWIFTLMGIGVVGFLGYRHIGLSSKVLIIVLVAEVGIVLILSAAIWLKGGTESIDLAGFTSHSFMSGSPALGLMFAIASFIGFESTVVYRSEVREPNRTIPLATYGSALLIGLFYTLAGVAVVWGIGPSKLMTYVGSDPATVLPRLTGEYLGAVGSTVVSLLFLGSMFASVLALHNVLARYLHSMARARLLPAKLALAHPKHDSPYVSSLVQVITAAVLTVIVVVLKVPAASAFAWFVGVGTLTISILMAVTCLAVIVFFARNKLQTHVLRTCVAPLLGFIGLAVSAVLIAVNFPLLVGDVDSLGEPAWGTVSVVLILLVVVTAIAGAAQAMTLRFKNRQVYRQITQQLNH